MRRGVRVLGAAIAAGVLLSACAAEPRPDWEPPHWEATADTELISGLVHSVPDADAEPETDVEAKPGAEPETEGEAGTGSEAGTESEAGTDAGSDPEVAPEDDADAEPDAADESGDEAPTREQEALNERRQELQQLGLIGQRIRNDALGVQARWAILPGHHAFNDRMEQLVWQAIDEAGGDYEPQVLPSGLSDRGCLPGSLVWSAERVLTDPATGPAEGDGTAITCEIAGAFGPYIGVSLRVVTSDATGIADDRRTTVYANLDSGELIESDELWNSDAAPELWERTIELLRREAGGLSAAPVGAPDAAQTALAERALESAQIQEGGSALVTLPPGLASPELSGLGVAATVDPVQVLVDAETATEWAHLEDDLLAEAVDSPFRGVDPWTADTHVDCDLVPCIAITYDDGPSEYTPQLLETLREHRAPATFFMLGRSMRADPDTVAQVAAEGHEVASHTMQHPDLTELKPKKMTEEVMDAAGLIEEITGNDVTSYRPPYGAIDKEVEKEIELPAILWTIDTLDWERPGLELLLDRAVDEADPGDIVLFHDIHEPSVAAAGPVFDGIADRGFVPVTVTQLFDGKIPSGKVTGR